MNGGGRLRRICGNRSRFGDNWRFGATFSVIGSVFFTERNGDFGPGWRWRGYAVGKIRAWDQGSMGRVWSGEWMFAVSVFCTTKAQRDTELLSGGIREGSIGGVCGWSRPFFAQMYSPANQTVGNSDFSSKSFE